MKPTKLIKITYKYTYFDSEGIYEDWLYMPGNADNLTFDEAEEKVISFLNRTDHAKKFNKILGIDNLGVRLFRE